MSERSEIHTVDAAESDPGSVTTILVGAVGISLLVVTVLVLEVLFHRTAETERYRKVISQPPQELRQVQAEQLERLNGWRWVDREKGLVAIPVDRAMNLLVEEDAAASGK